MAKALKTAALVVGAVALAVALPGIGAGIAGSLGGLVGVSAVTATSIIGLTSPQLSVSPKMIARKVK